jgi:hypothetical protein
MNSVADTVGNSTDALAEGLLEEDLPDDPQAERDQEEDEETNLHKNQRGATMLEWTLLLAAIALPSWFIIKMTLSALAGYYRMMTTINGLPFP